MYLSLEHLNQIEMLHTAPFLEQFIHGKKVTGISVRNALKRPIFSFLCDIFPICIVVIIVDCPGYLNLAVV